MKIPYKILIIVGILAASLASAGNQQEVHLYASGEAKIVGELFRKHAVNLFTVKSWDYKWLIPIDVTDTKIKFESAYGAPIELREMVEGHLLEIKGKHIYKNFEYSIEPVLIKDLSIKIGEPPPPPPVVIQPPQAAGIIPFPSSPSIIKGGGEGVGLPASSLGKSNPPKTGKLTITLKPGYWGGQVKILQEFLKKEGYFPQKEPTSRYFGPTTKKALIEFQKANALEAIGTLGPKTRALVNSLINQ